MSDGDMDPRVLIAVEALDHWARYLADDDPGFLAELAVRSLEEVDYRVSAELDDFLGTPEMAAEYARSSALLSDTEDAPQPKNSSLFVVVDGKSVGGEELPQVTHERISGRAGFQPGHHARRPVAVLPSPWLQRPGQLDVPAGRVPRAHQQVASALAQRRVPSQPWTSSRSRKRGRTRPTA